jgi:hypothetical protein
LTEELEPQRHRDTEKAKTEKKIAREGRQALDLFSSHPS